MLMLVRLGLFWHDIRSLLASYAMLMLVRLERGLRQISVCLLLTM
jgi:hypothetical protein